MAIKLTMKQLEAKLQC